MIENNKLPENSSNITSIDIPKKEKVRRLTIRERRLIKNLIDPKIKTQKEAGIRAGYKKKSVDNIVNQKLQKPTFLTSLHKELEKIGLTDKRLSEKFQELLDAKKVISANIINVNGEGMKDANSMTKDFIDVPDNDVQLRTATTIAKLKGHFMKVESGFNLEIDNSMKVNNIQINFVKKSDNIIGD